MARLTDLPEWDQRRHLDRIKALPDFGPTPFVPGPPLGERRVAIVTTAGIHVRGARPFEVGSADYRIIPWLPLITTRVYDLPPAAMSSVDPASIYLDLDLGLFRRVFLGFPIRQ